MDGTILAARNLLPNKGRSEVRKFNIAVGPYQGRMLVPTSKDEIFTPAGLPLLMGKTQGRGSWPIRLKFRAHIRPAPFPFEEGMTGLKNFSLSGLTCLIFSRRTRKKFVPSCRTKGGEIHEKIIWYFDNFSFCSVIG